MDEVEAVVKGARGAWGRERLRWVCLVLVGLASVVLIARGCARWNVICDNLTAFAVPMACGLVVVFLLALLSRDRLAILLATIVLAWGWYPVVVGGLWRAPSAEVDLRILALNVKTANRDFERACDFIAGSAADVVVVTEVDEDWERALHGLEERYPNQVCEPRFDNFGIAILSRLPLKDAEVLEPSQCTPMIRAVIECGGRPITLFGVHPLPPMGEASFHSRNVQLLKISELARMEHNSVIVAGDLNVAPWSPYFRWLLEDGGLLETRRALDWTGSYPTRWPIGRARIDHILVSAQLGAAESALGEDIGSDHLPVWATVGFRREGVPGVARR